MESTWYWIFYKETLNQYIVLSDNEVTGEGRYQLWHDGYELLSDCRRSQQDAEQYVEREYRFSKLKLKTWPISLREAAAFVNTYHRHHIAPQGHKFSISLTDGDVTAGVIIAGRPVSRYQDDGRTLEITRCCVKEIYKNGVSQLYSAVCRAAKAMSLKHTFGSVSRKPKDPIYDIPLIYRECGLDTLVDLAIPDSKGLQDYITKGFITKKVIDQFRRPENIRMDFMVMSLEAEGRMMNMLAKKRMISEANRRALGG